MICPVCGIEFEPSYSRQVCCSPECQKKRHNSQKTGGWNKKIGEKALEAIKEAQLNENFTQRYPCNECEYVNRPSCACNEWKSWFINEWERACRRLR